MGRKSIRIPFAEAIAEPRLLQPRFSELGLGQRVQLKILYGLPLSADVKDDLGWSELDYYSASQGHAEFDELGYIKRIIPGLNYVPKEFRECWIVAGRRSGKTDCAASTIVAYEATCGGHEVWKREGKPALCFQVAQDTRMAKFALHSINATLQSMDFIYNKGDQKKNRILQVTADRIDLWNGMTVQVLPPTTKSVRGYDNPVAVLDEVGVWYQDSDSANPDYEIYRAVSPGQAQFPDAKIVGISSPWNKSGLLFKFYEAGTEGARLMCETCRVVGKVKPDCPGCALVKAPHRGRLIMHTTTAASCNPLIRRTWLEDERNRDPRAYDRECLARFQDSLSGFLNSTLIEKARAVGVTARPPVRRNFYIAAMDPAFRKDAFGFTIVHSDPTIGVVQDVVRRWHDPTGTPLNPGDIFPQIAALLHEYGIKSVFSDQYTLEALQFIAAQFGFSIQEVTFSAGSKAEIYGNLASLLNQHRLSLLDDQETINELKGIEKRLTQAGQVQISAPEGSYDDMATVVAIAAHEAVWMLPAAEKPRPEDVKPQGMIARHIDHLAQTRRRLIRETQSDWLD